MRLKRSVATSLDRKRHVQLSARPDEEIDQDIAELLRLLDGDAREKEVHEFLASHVYCFNNIARHTVPVYSKVRLGAQFEADFGFVEPSSFGAEWHFVEIERPGMRLATSSGRISAELNHAVQQARDWKFWLLENRSYARKTMPRVEHPFFHVFAGRRESLGTEGRALLRELNYENRHWLEVGLLDRFVSGAESAKSLNVVQLGSYSFREMSRRQPSEAFDWLLSAQTAEYKEMHAASLLEERVRIDRDHVPQG